MWDLIVSVPDHCLSFYFGKIKQCTFLYILALCKKAIFQNQSSKNKPEHVVIVA